MHVLAATATHPVEARLAHPRLLRHLVLMPLAIALTHCNYLYSCTTPHLFSKELLGGLIELEVLSSPKSLVVLILDTLVVTFHDFYKLQ